jgi:hypothetical protein
MPAPRCSAAQIDPRNSMVAVYRTVITHFYPSWVFDRADEMGATGNRAGETGATGNRAARPGAIVAAVRDGPQPCSSRKLSTGCRT